MRAEDTLLVRCQQGNVTAFEELYQQHATRLYNVAYRMVGNASDAEDLLQEIFLLAYRKLSSFRGDSTLATWLHRLAMNACLDHLRSRAAKTAHATSSLEGDPGGGRTLDPAAPIEMTAARIDLEKAPPEGVAARRRDRAHG